MSSNIRIDHGILLAALRHPCAGLRHPDVDRIELKLCGGGRPLAAWTPADGDCLEWVRSQGIPIALVQVFEDGWPNAVIEIVPWARLWDLASIRKEMTERPAYFKHGLLILGSALNGDMIVMDLQHHPGAMGYVSLTAHLGQPVNLREEFFEVSPSLGAFALGVVKDSLPIDSYGTWSDENENGTWFEDVEQDPLE